MKIFLVAGRARSGKSLVAKLIKDELIKNGKNAIITEYSKYIKLFAKEMLGWDGVSEPKPRKFLQDMGNYVREYYSDIYFTDRMKEDMKIYENFVDDVIISDVRMPQELEALNDYQCVKILVKNENLLYDLDEIERRHITEHALDDYKEFDYILEDLSEDEISKEVIKIVKENEL